MRGGELRASPLPAHWNAVAYFARTFPRMTRSTVLLHETRRVLTFAVATQVCAFVLNWYAKTPFHPAQFMWLLFGLLIGVVEQFFFTGRVARLPVYAQLILRVVIIWFVGITLVTLLMLLHWVPPAFQALGIRTVTDLWSHPLAFGLITNAMIISAAVILFMEMERMVGSRMFHRFLTGRYVHPKREDRVVMFMDLAGSTTLTEQLGDRRYFDMLNETFDRMTGPILKSGAEVLKYIGDEVIFIWNARGDGRDLRCIDLYFDIEAAIARDRSHYERVYGVVPHFRAGCHRGVVITAQIGTIKRTIDLSGDAMNTCARLQGATKQLKADLVASEELLASADDAASRFKLSGPIPMELRGKAEPMQVRTVARA